jgi:hypothetical protein
MVSENNKCLCECYMIAFEVDGEGEWKCLCECYMIAFEVDGEWE